MKILALETSMEACSVAIYDAAKDRVLAEAYDVPGRGHAEILFDRIKAVTDRAGVAPKDIDRFAATVGPGSFTGVRIALSAARGFALAAQKPLIGIGSLEAIAAAVAARPDEVVAIAHDARRGEIYLQAFASGKALFDPLVAPVAEAAETAAAVASGRPIAVAGSGAALLSAALGDLPHRTLPAEPWPRASIVARLAAAREPPPEKPLPLYLRAPDARLPAAKAPP